MDYKEAYYRLIGQIDDIITALENEYSPIIKTIEDLKLILLKSEEDYLRIRERN